MRRPSARRSVARDASGGSVMAAGAAQVSRKATMEMASIRMTSCCEPSQRDLAGHVLLRRVEVAPEHVAEVLAAARHHDVGLALVARRELGELLALHAHGVALRRCRSW